MHAFWFCNLPHSGLLPYTDSDQVCRVGPDIVYEIMCSVDFCFGLTDMRTNTGSEYHSSEKHASQILFTDKEFYFHR